MRFRIKSEDSGESNIFWVTMTDLMTALVLVFIVLFFYFYLMNMYEKMENNIEQNNASKALQETLQEENLDVNIDKNGVVKISDLELFDLNSYELSERGKKYLDKFTPAYFNSIFENDYMNKNVDKIIIQGHTDSQTYKGEFSQDEQYMKNMELSLKRAFAVANYMTSTKYKAVNGERLRKMILVEGASYSNPVLVNNKEDYSKSRRVELKLVMKAKIK